jgi:stearoyl-CoA desaturase (delta-9 desaturase)
VLATQDSPISPARGAAQRPPQLRTGLTLFTAIHAACVLVIWTGTSPIALLTCGIVYVIQVFGMSAGYHRYLAHRTFETSRSFQFVLALMATLSGQQGPLWWAGHHRHHHRHADAEGDVHPPHLRGFWWAHVGWITSGHYLAARLEAVPDLVRFPELRVLDRYNMVPPAALAAGILVLGILLGAVAPGLGTSGPQMLVWGFCFPTVLSYHATFAVNSVAHLWGRRRFDTPDESRNNVLLGLLAFGEGWHNNHHRCPRSERNGFYWWEVDVTHYLLTVLSWMGLVWNLRTPPAAVYAEGRRTGQRLR